MTARGGIQLSLSSLVSKITSILIQSWGFTCISSLFGSSSIFSIFVSVGRRSGIAARAETERNLRVSLSIRAALLVHRSAHDLFKARLAKVMRYTSAIEHLVYTHASGIFFTTFTFHW